MSLKQVIKGHMKSNFPFFIFVILLSIIYAAEKYNKQTMRIKLSHTYVCESFNSRLPRMGY